MEITNSLHLRRSLPKKTLNSRAVFNKTLGLLDLGERFPLPWELDPSRHTSYDDDLLKDMIVFRKKYEDKKQSIEDEQNKEKKREKESIRPRRPVRRGHRPRRR